MNRIGKRLKEERLRLKISQSTLGSVGGVETNAQGNYESGLRFPRADYLSRIAQGGIDVAYVVTGCRLPTADAASEVDESLPALPGEPSEGDRLASLIERLQGNLHGITTDLYHISRLAEVNAAPDKSDTRQGQLEVIKNEAEAIALATMRLIFVTSRLN